MVDSYETIDFLREQKIKLGNATYIVNSHFLEHGARPHTTCCAQSIFYLGNLLPAVFTWVAR